MLNRRRLLTTALLTPALLRAGAPSFAFAAGATPTAGEPGDNGWIVDAAWLAKRLGSPGVKVIALQDAAGFANAHLPGAAQTDWDQLEIGDTSRPSVARWRTAMAAVFAKLGIAPDDTVISYDAGTFYAARIWWVLDQIGHADKRLLSGGLAGWTAAGGKTETGASSVKPLAEPLPIAPNEAGISTLDETKAALNDKSALFIDARQPDEYAAGHIPGAVNVPRLSNATGGPEYLWKSSAELTALYQQAGVTPDRQVIPYCSTGVRSAATHLALRSIGHDKVSLFTGSWNEWSSHPDLPVTTGDKP